ncbi:MAG: hypothetical protein SGJ09_08840 [Phycisphaerae bacterium]|nr:hypothetical protein [Phycisphaerae bacterium]
MADEVTSESAAELEPTLEVAPELEPTPVSERTPIPVRSRRGAAAHPHPGWSGLPLAASLALVAFAVIFGVYGPRVVDRATPPLGIPAWDLGEAASARHFEQRMSALHGPGADPVTAHEAEEELRSILGERVTVPDLSGLGFTLYRPRLVSLPGAARAALLYYARSRPGGPESISLVVVPDREQYVVFSPFGRPLFLPRGEVHAVDLPNEGSEPGHGFLWSDGSFVRVAISLTGSTIDDVADLLLASSSADDGNAGADGSPIVPPSKKTETNPPTQP